LTRCDFQRVLSSLFWGAALAGFNGDAFDFLRGIGSDGYTGRWGARVSRDIFPDVISI
jgi:hypothetical protein